MKRILILILISITYFQCCSAVDKLIKNIEGKYMWGASYDDIVITTICFEATTIPTSTSARPGTLLFPNVLSIYSDGTFGYNDSIPPEQQELINSGVYGDVIIYSGQWFLDGDHLILTSEYRKNSDLERQLTEDIGKEIYVVRGEVLVPFDLIEFYDSISGDVFENTLYLSLYFKDLSQHRYTKNYYMGPATKKELPNP